MLVPLELIISWMTVLPFTIVNLHRGRRSVYGTEAGYKWRNFRSIFFSTSCWLDLSGPENSAQALNIYVLFVLLVNLASWWKCCFNNETLKTSGLNPFPHIDAFWHLCSRRLFENIVTKEEIAQNEQFLLLTQCFALLVIGYPFNYRDFLVFDKICSKSSAVELSYEGKG